MCGGKGETETGEGPGEEARTMMLKKAKLQKTTLEKTGERQASWHRVDADGQVLGRLASEVAVLLMGKHRPEYTPHVDSGDFVVVTNCEKVLLTGRKADTKVYQRYSYYMGGRKEISFRDVMAKKPEMVLTEAVRRMLPKSKLGRQMLKKLKVYAGSEHPHAAQQPEAYELKSQGTAK